MNPKFSPMLIDDIRMTRENQNFIGIFYIFIAYADSVAKCSYEM